jgi:hypothetical protein
MRCWRRRSEQLSGEGLSSEGLSGEGLSGEGLSGEGARVKAYNDPGNSLRFDQLGRAVSAA